MKIVFDRAISASPEQVWQALTDPVRLKACIPGCRAFVRIDDARWGAIAALKIHTLTLELSSKVEITMAYPPEGFVLHFSISHPASGHITGMAQAKLVAGPEDETPLTFIHYDVCMQANGPLANINERLIKEVAHRWADMFFVRLGDALKAEEAQADSSFGLFSRFSPFAEFREKQESNLRDHERLASSPTLAA